MEYQFIKEFILNEEKTQDRLSQIKLGYNYSDLEPSLSTESVKLHYGKLYKTYVERFNTGEGDADFNEAGAYLHGIYFSQFKSFDSKNKPTNESLEVIYKNHGTFDEFKKEFEETALSVQGSGWIYLSKNGQIKTIKNHAMRSDILLLIDWWEHAFMLDYGPDKKKYLDNQWKIIDWSVIDSRLKDNTKDAQP